MAAHVLDASGGQLADLPASGRQLGSAATHGGVRCRVVPAQGRREGATRHREGGERHRRRRQRAAGPVPERQGHRSHLRHVGSRPAARGRDADHRTHPRPGARNRARSRPRVRGQEPDHSARRVRREGGSARDLLQRDARRAGQHRRRADLEPHQGQRPEVRRQHELGPVPARSEQDLLPASRAVVAQGV